MTLEAEIRERALGVSSQTEKEGLLTKADECRERKEKGNEQLKLVSQKYSEAMKQLREQPSTDRPSSAPGVASAAAALLANAGAKDEAWKALAYLGGFGSHFATEAVQGALPVGQNSPQKVPFGLFAEQLQGSAFTCPRTTNRRSWVYRLSPSAAQARMVPSARTETLVSSDFHVVDPRPRRWGAMPLPSASGTDWLSGLRTICGAGGPTTKDGVAIHMYGCNAPMVDCAFCNADGELLIVPQLGVLLVTTELGRLRVAPGEIVVIPRNIRFAIDPIVPALTTDTDEAACRGYVLEVFTARGLTLPDLGPIGANGLAEPRDFMSPSAWYEDRECAAGFTITTKYAGKLFDAECPHSPWDVVAWHGNYTPYKYDLSRFHAINTVTVDHSDPSIFTVLSAPSSEPGVAVADFVIFPPRWMCAESTFRPPYFHRNVMSEFMGLVGGTYDAKKGGKGGFVPGGASLHVASTPHGPDATTYAAAVAADTTKPIKFGGGLAFMFETNALLTLTAHAVDPEKSCVQEDYHECWKGLPRARIPV